MTETYLDFYEQINAQKQINKLAKKYKNKKILIYGAGIMTRILFENFDLKNLNIVGVCDLKFENSTNENFFSYPAISPNILGEYDFDVIFVNLRNQDRIIKNIKYRKLVNTKNEDKEVTSLLKQPLSFLIKQILL